MTMSKLKLIHVYFDDGIFWIRLFGKGISVVDKKKYPPLFSERFGYRKVVRIGKWGIEWLKQIY